MEYNVSTLEEWNEIIEKKATEFGLKFYPQEFEIIGFNEMLGLDILIGVMARLMIKIKPYIH